MPKIPKSGSKEGARTKETAAKPRRASTRAKPKAKKATSGGNSKSAAATAVAEKNFERRHVDQAPTHAPAGPKSRLSDDQRILLGDLFAVVGEHTDGAPERVDRKQVEKSFVFSCERHADQRRASGEDFIVHPIGVAKICAGMRLDTGTLSALPKQKQQEIAKETLEIFAPLAHRLGIHAIKWELEDLAFATLHPRKYKEIKGLVNQQREEREAFVGRAGEILKKELDEVEIEADISGRAKHFYSIYSKMTKKGREFNEIYDLTAMRVLVGSVKDCYGAIGVIHSLWKPLPGRFKDFIATPKLNLYQARHTTVVGPEGRPLEIQVRTSEMHELAEYGIAAHVLYKEGARRGKGAVDAERDKMTWLRQLLDEDGEQDPRKFLEQLKVDLFEDEVFVFTPRGEVKNLSAESTPLDFAYAVHTDVGHRCVGAKVNGKIAPP